MDKVLIFISGNFVFFVRNAIGCINSPYSTYRTLSKNEDVSFQTVFIFIPVIIYFLFASLIRMGLQNPFLLTVKFNTLILGAIIGFLGMVLVLYYFGRLAGGIGKLGTIFTLWSFTLFPSLIWFLTTSLLYIFLPPPRTMSIFGKLYSVVFITFSLSLFFWKIILYYLTIRFGLKLDFLRIGLISLVVIPAIAGYSLIMYRLGVFRIPFI